MLGRRGALAGLGALGFVRPARAEPDPRYPAGRALTAEQDATTYNNYYEFGTDKSIYRAAQRLPTTPWKIELAGMMEKPRTMDLDDLLKQVTQEERVYRHRCVETWAMTVPWTGFPLKALVALAAPDRQREIHHVRDAGRPEDHARAALRLFQLPLCRRADAAGGEQRPRLHGHRHVRQAGAEAGRSADPPGGAPGNTASNPPSRSSRSASPTSSRTRSGTPSSLPNTASGPTSTQPCRIHAGARRPRRCSAPRSACRRRSGTAMGRSSPTCYADKTNERLFV